MEVISESRRPNSPTALLKPMAQSPNFIWQSTTSDVSIYKCISDVRGAVVGLTDCRVYPEHSHIQGGSNMTGTDLCVNKPHCAAAVRP